jgi:hypothetical protein
LLVDLATGIFLPPLSPFQPEGAFLWIKYWEYKPYADMLIQGTFWERTRLKSLGQIERNRGSIYYIVALSKQRRGTGK